MVVLREKGSQKLSWKIILRAAEYEAVRKQTVTPIKKMRIEHMTIPKQNKVVLENDVTTRNNLDLSLGIYLTTAKVAQCIIVLLLRISQG